MITAAVLGGMVLQYYLLHGVVGSLGCEVWPWLHTVSAVLHDLGILGSALVVMLILVITC